MATSDYGAVYYPPATGVAADVPAQMALAAESLEGDTVVSFVDIGTRDTKFATLTTAQKKGVICHVEGQGAFISDGTTWRRVLVPGISMNKGNAQGSCDINGIFSVNHGLPSPPTSVQVTMEGDNTQIKFIHPVVVLIDSTRILVKFWYNDPAGGALQLNSGAWTSFYWAAYL